MCYAPVRHWVVLILANDWTPFDLHVLSTPPAFVLSQDQTLRLEETRTSILKPLEIRLLFEPVGPARLCL